MEFFDRSKFFAWFSCQLWYIKWIRFGRLLTGKKKLSEMFRWIEEFRLLENRPKVCNFVAKFKRINLSRSSKCIFVKLEKFKQKQNSGNLINIFEWHFAFKIKGEIRIQLFWTETLEETSDKHDHSSLSGIKRWQHFYHPVTAETAITCSRLLRLWNWYTGEFCSVHFCPALYNDANFPILTGLCISMEFKT